MNTTSQIQIAKDLFYQKKYIEAVRIFKQYDENYCIGLCYLLLKSPKKAFYFWNKGKNYSPACIFGLNIIKLITNNDFDRYEVSFSFFQIRTFLEIYISLFIENDLIDWCEILVNNADLFYGYNPESYKFIARALYANGYFDLGITFCKKTLDIFYSDPEALLIMAQCYYLLDKKETAKLYNDKLNKIIKDYYPAILFDEILSKEVQ